jgi:RNA polymerase sigma factor (sigma-70 family)
MTVEKALQSLQSNPRDTHAWELVANEVYQPLLAYVASLLLTFNVAPGETSHDIVHEVLLAFYERWPKSRANITSATALHAYLRTSCRNLLIDRYRRQRNAEQLIDFLTLTFERAFQNESNLYKSIFLEEIINLLSPECALLFRKYITEGLSPAEVADSLGASPDTFYSRWRRCLQKAKIIYLHKKGPLKRL